MLCTAAAAKASWDVISSTNGGEESSSTNGGEESSSTNGGDVHCIAFDSMMCIVMGL